MLQLTTTADSLLLSGASVGCPSEPHEDLIINSLQFLILQ